MVPLFQFGGLGRRWQAQNARAHEALFIRLLGLIGCGDLIELALAHRFVHASQVCLGLGHAQGGHIAIVRVRFG